MKRILYITLAMLASHVSMKAQDVPDIWISRQSAVMGNAISCLDYDCYLKQKDFPCTLYAATDEAMLRFVDPVSYGEGKAQIWEVRKDENQTSTRCLYADVYNCVIKEDGTVEKVSEEPVTTITGGIGNSQIENRMKYLIKNSLVFGERMSGKKYYKSYGNNFVRVEDGGSAIYGPWQAGLGKPVEVIESTATSAGEVVEISQPLMPSFKNVATTLAEHSEFSEFLSILQTCALSTSNSKDHWQSADQVYGNLFNLKERGAVGAEDMTSYRKATYLLDDYHYTLYAPTNAAMQEAHALGLPTLEDLDDAWEEDERNGIEYNSPESKYAKVLEVMLNFVKYHIQDEAVFVDGGDNSGWYDSGKLSFIPSIDIDEETGDASWNGKYRPGRPYKLKVDVTPSSMTVTDCRNGYDSNGNPSGGVTANVVTTPGLYNLMANEIWIDSYSIVRTPYSCNIAIAPFVVIHAIDSPLIYADGKHTDSLGRTIPTQFEYQYYPMSTGY